MKPLENKNFFNKKEKLNATLVSGVNGVGKTTTIGKMGKILKSNGNKISLNKNVFNNNRTYYIKNILDIELMNDACKILLNHTNFKCFSKSKTDVKTYNCDLVYANWKLYGNELIFKIKANRFLRNMVRAIVGTIVHVGLKKISLKEFENIIISQDRTKAGPSAPAHALYLSNIEYPKEIRSNE